MLRTAQSLPQEWAFDTGLRPRPFPDEAASLLPGPLAATRTGLTPASDDELTTQDQPPTRSTSCLLGARKGLIVERDRLATRQSRRPHPRFRQPEATSPSPRYRNAAAMVTTGMVICCRSRPITVATPWSSSRSPSSSPPDRRSCLGTPKDGGAGRPATRSCPTPTRQPAHQARAMSISGDVHPGLRTTKPIESTFASVRHRTKITRGPGSRAAGLGVAFKFIQAAQDRWQVVNAPHLVALVRADAVRQRQARRTTRRTPPMGSRLKVLHPQASDAPEAVDVVHGPYCRPGAFSSGCLEEVFDSLGGFVHRDGSDTARRRSDPR